MEKVIDPSDFKSSQRVQPGETFQMTPDRRQFFTDRRLKIFQAYQDAVAAGAPRSLADIGKEFSVSGERVRQIVKLGHAGKLDVRSRKDAVARSA